jgi:hypothetical protein
MNKATENGLHIHNLEWLVHLARPFPVSAGRMKELAHRWGFDRHVQDLLAEFPEDEEFDSGDDFLTRCEELEFLEGEEADMPEETLHSPQD